MPKITKRLIDAVDPEDKDVFIRDSEIKGFICKVTPKGKKVYMLYYRTKDGRERKPAIGAHGNITCDQAREIALNWMSEVAKGNDPSLDKTLAKRKKTDIHDLASRYLEEYANLHKKQSSIRSDKIFLKHYILPYFDKMKLDSLTTKDIAKFHYSLREKSTTANRCISLLSKMLNLAERWGLCNEASLLCKHVDKFPEVKREKFLSMDEIERLSNVLKEVEHNQSEMPGVINAIRLLLLTGCRLSEILTLKWAYIDIAHHRINFPDSKTGKKTVYISPYVIELLNKIERKPYNPYVIEGAIEGKHLVNLRKPWYRIRKMAELNDMRIHDLRHSFASIGAASGLSLPVIGALLGHTQAQTTARYAHLVGDPLKEAAHVIGSKIKAVMG